MRKKLFFIFCTILAFFVISNCAVDPVGDDNSDIESNEQSINYDMTSNDSRGTSSKDVSVTKVYITKYTSSKIWYEITVKNKGSKSVPLKEIGFQAYINMQDKNPVPAGGSVIGMTGNLDPGKSKTKTFSCNIDVNLTKLTYYAYLDVELTSGSFKIVEIPCYKPDLYGYGGEATLASNKSVTWFLTIKNKGLNYANIKKSVAQAYISEDKRLDKTDDPCGGLIIGIQNETLERDESIVTGLSSVPIDSDLYKKFKSGTKLYLLVKVDENNKIKEFNEDNNIEVIIVRSK